MSYTTNTLETRVRQAIRQLCNLPGNLEAEDDPAFSTEQVNLLEKRLYEACSLLQGEDGSHLYADSTLYVHHFLAKHRQIAAIWCIEDVLSIRPDLTAEQAWEVLEEVSRKHDAEYGISWTTLQCMADILFGNAPKTDEAEEAQS